MSRSLFILFIIISAFCLFVDDYVQLSSSVPTGKVCLYLVEEEEHDEMNLLLEDLFGRTVMVHGICTDLPEFEFISVEPFFDIGMSSSCWAIKVRHVTSLGGSESQENSDGQSSVTIRDTISQDKLNLCHLFEHRIRISPGTMKATDEGTVQTALLVAPDTFKHETGRSVGFRADSDLSLRYASNKAIPLTIGRCRYGT